MYADAGFEDILYGFPYIPSHQARAWKLRERLHEFHLMVATRGQRRDDRFVTSGRQFGVGPGAGQPGATARQNLVGLPQGGLWQR